MPRIGYGAKHNTAGSGCNRIAAESAAVIPSLEDFCCFFSGKDCKE
jgi:hypothetical protein